MNYKRWSVVFRALANINRLKIISLLSEQKRLSVGEIADELKISLKATSNHLIMLKNLGVLEDQGTGGRVYYFLSPEQPVDFVKILKVLL